MRFSDSTNDYFVDVYDVSTGTLLSSNKITDSSQEPRVSFTESAIYDLPPDLYNDVTKLNGDVEKLEWRRGEFE